MGQVLVSWMVFCVLVMMGLGQRLGGVESSFCEHFSGWLVALITWVVVFCDSSYLIS
jgi:hypothetical protein